MLVLNERAERLVRDLLTAHAEELEDYIRECSSEDSKAADLNELGFVLAILKGDNNA